MRSEPPPGAPAPGELDELLRPRVTERHEAPSGSGRVAAELAVLRRVFRRRRRILELVLSERPVGPIDHGRVAKQAVLFSGADLHGAIERAVARSSTRRSRPATTS